MLIISPLANAINNALRPLGGGSGAPTTRLAPNFNGISQYASISMPTSIGDVVRFKIIASGSGTGARVMLASGPTSGNHIYFIGTTINLDGGRFTAKVNGSDVIPGITQIPMDGMVYEFELTSTGNYDVNFVASKSDNFYCDFPIFDLSLNDGSVHNYPMDDGWANNPTTRNTGSGANGTFINMTEAAWVEMPA